MRHKRFTLLNPTKSVRSNLTGLKLSAVLLLVSGLTGLQAQEAIPATGGDASGSGGSVSYTAGQVVYTTNTGTAGSAEQGVQQPYEISAVTGIEDAAEITLSVSVYPNPATDYLTLSIDETANTTYDLSQLSYLLYDMNGKLLQNEKITGYRTNIVMSNLGPATYFVKVIQSNNDVHHVKSSEDGRKLFSAVKIFKIIKN